MIRADQLQIGNFVLVDGKPRRVESITKNKIGYHINEEKKRLYYARLCEVFPIEINDYILRMSGFCVDETEKRLHAIFDNDEMRVEVFLFKIEKAAQVILKNKDTHSCYLGDLRYIHEFQHIFRPCGLKFEVKL